MSAKLWAYIRRAWHCWLGADIIVEVDLDTGVHVARPHRSVTERGRAGQADAGKVTALACTCGRVFWVRPVRLVEGES